MLFASSAARTAALASPSQGMRSYLTDSNSAWQYYEAYNSSTNPGGAATAGWYPAEGTVLFAGKRSNTSLSITTATYTVISFNTFSCSGSTSNTDTIQINSATTPSTFTVRKAGWYSISYDALNSGWSSVAGTIRSAMVNTNSTTGTTNRFLFTEIGVDPALAASATGTYYLAADDVVRMFQYQNSGVSATNNNTNLSIIYLRPASV